MRNQKPYRPTFQHPAATYLTFCDHAAPQLRRQLLKASGRRHRGKFWLTSAPPSVATTTASATREGDATHGGRTGRHRRHRLFDQHDWQGQHEDDGPRVGKTEKPNKPTLLRTQMRDKRHTYLTKRRPGEPTQRTHVPVHVYV